MTDDLAREPVEEPAQTSQPGERGRRSRRRGKRSKNKSQETQASPQQIAPATVRTSEKPPAAAPARGGRKAPHKSGYQPFNDGLDRFVCPECLRFLPREFPVQYRRGIATLPLHEVDRRGAELLLCNELHSGPCLWPDGVLVQPVAPEPTPPVESPNDRPADETGVTTDTLPVASDIALAEIPVDDDQPVSVPAAAPMVRRLTRSPEAGSVAT